MALNRLKSSTYPLTHTVIDTLFYDLLILSLEERLKISGIITSFKIKNYSFTEMYLDSQKLPYLPFEHLHKFQLVLI